jgi:hypothetical protein
MKVNKIELFALLNQADDELLQIIYSLLLKVNDIPIKKTISTSYDSNLFLEKLHEVQKIKPFSTIQNSTDWQKQIRNEWE